METFSFSVNDRVHTIIDLTNEFLFGDNDPGKNNVVVPRHMGGTVLKLDTLGRNSAKVRFDNRETWWIENAPEHIAYGAFASDTVCTVVDLTNRILYGDYDDGLTIQGANEIAIPKGTLGVVVKLGDDGDALIEFETLGLWWLSNMMEYVRYV